MVLVAQRNSVTSVARIGISRIVNEQIVIQANQNGIDASGLKTVDELRSRLQLHNLPYRPSGYRTSNHRLTSWLTAVATFVAKVSSVQISSCFSLPANNRA